MGAQLAGVLERWYVPLTASTDGGAPSTPSLAGNLSRTHSLSPQPECQCLLRRDAHRPPGTAELPSVAGAPDEMQLVQSLREMLVRRSSSRSVSQVRERAGVVAFDIPQDST